MNDYSIIHGILDSVFASDLGRSEAEENALFFEMVANSEYKRKLREALISAFQNPDFSWADILNEYEVYPTDNELDARNYAIRFLWSPVFPHDPPPGGS
ncbi:hypothetical protein [Achromobacter sp. Root83]|uniref:hypothetical protein n=1 Tax=Achromobacter sp. Root83 TaxID=1736602 RepID=UPI0012E33B34|nr:hypothetical protein [Achromobacter sp. Root83]